MCNICVDVISFKIIDRRTIASACKDRLILKKLKSYGDSGILISVSPHVAYNIYETRWRALATDESELNTNNTVW